MRSIRLLLFNITITLVLIGGLLISGCTTSREDHRFLELLKLMPASAGEDGCFFLVDYEILWNKLGVEFPSSNVSQKDLYRSFAEKMMDGSNPDSHPIIYSSFYTGWGIDTGWSGYRETPIQNKYVGYGITNTDAEINSFIRTQIITTLPGRTDEANPVLNSKVAAIGEFDPVATRNALNNRDEWPDWAIENYSSESYRNITIHNWIDGTDDHPGNAFLPPNLNGPGHALPFAVSSNNLYVGDSVPAVESMIDSKLGKSDSLADLDEYASVAEALYELGAYVAIIGDESWANGIWGPYRGENNIVDFLTFGTGYARDEKGLYIALVLAHDSVEKAKTNVDSLPKRVGEWAPYPFDEPGEAIYDMQIYNEENVLLAKLYTNDPSLWSWWLLSGGDFLSHGE